MAQRVPNDIDEGIHQRILALAAAQGITTDESVREVLRNVALGNVALGNVSLKLGLGASMQARFQDYGLETGEEIARHRRDDRQTLGSMRSLAHHPG